MAFLTLQSSTVNREEVMELNSVIMLNFTAHSCHSIIYINNANVFVFIAIGDLTLSLCYPTITLKAGESFNGSKSERVSNVCTKGIKYE